MNNTPGLVTISYVVNSILNRRGDYTNREKLRLTQLVIDGLTELNLFHMDSFDIAYLTPNAANICTLPPDFVDYTKIGVSVCGKIWTLTINKSLLPARVGECGSSVRDVCSGTCSEPTSGYSFIDHYRGDNFVSAMYTMGGGINDAYYRIDRKNRQLILDGSLPKSEVVLEYKTTGVNGKNTLVPREAVPALRAYVGWADIEDKDTVHESVKESKRRKFYLEVDKLALLHIMPTADEISDTLSSTYSQGVKR